MGLARFVDDVVARLEATPIELSLLAPDAVAGSIGSGAAGVAFFLHEVARLRGDAGAIPLARQWLRAAGDWAAQATPVDWRGSPHGVAFGESGIAYVEALLGAHEGDPRSVVAAVEKIERSARRLTGEDAGERPAELVGGSAGVACAMRDLDARLPAGAAYDQARRTIARVRDHATEHLLARLAGPIELGPRDLIGVAHGIAGELWSLVMLLGADHPVVAARLSELAAAREIDEEGHLYWLASRDGDPALLATWCNGMAGHTLLWCEVARQRGSAESRELARKCAETTALVAGVTPTLCCGQTGQALALARYAALSGEARFARRAYDRLRSAARDVERGEEVPFLSLWRGTLGVALVAMRRMSDKGGFPCVEAHLAPSVGR